MRRYADHLKDELSSFVAEKESAVKDYSIDLDVQQKSAKELMNKLKLTEEDLAEKAKAIAKIDERINAYDTSLEELVRMTALVQGNLGRISEESAFVETVNKKVSDAHDKLSAIEKGIAGLKQRFEQDNMASLSKLSNSMLAEVKSSINTLKMETEAIQRNVTRQRDAIEKTEQVRSANLTRDMEAINKTLRDVAVRAGTAADKMEEATLVKLKSQSEERIQRLQSSIEENLKNHQEETRKQVAELDVLAAKQAEQWNANSDALEKQRRHFLEEWSHDVEELTTFFKTQQTEWMATADEKEANSKQTIAELERAAANIRSYIVEQNDALERKLKETQAHMDETIAVLEERLVNASREAERKVLERADERLGNWRQIALDADANLQKTLLGLEVSSVQIKDHFEKECLALEQRLKDTQHQTEEDIALLKRQIFDTAREAEAKISEEADANLEQIFHSFEDTNKRLSNMQSQTNEAVSQMENRLRETAAAVEKRALESVDIRLEDWKQGAADSEAKLKRLLYEIETAHDTAHTQLETEMEHIRQQLADAHTHTEQAITGFENSIARTAAAVDAKIASEADAKLVRWLHESENQDTKAKQILEELEEVVAQAKAHFAVELDALNKQLDGERAYTDEVIAELRDKFATEMEMIDGKLGDADAYTDEAILKLDKRLNAARTDFDSLTAGMKENIVQAVDEAKTDIATGFDIAKEQSGLWIAELEASFANTKIRLEEDIAKTEDRAQVFREQFEETVRRIEAAMSGAINNTDNKAVNAANDRLAQWKAAFEAGDAQSARRLEELETLFTQARAGIDSDLEQADEQTKRQIADLEAKLAHAKAGIDSDLEQADEQTKRQIADLEAKLAHARAGIDSDLEQADEKNKQHLMELEAKYTQTKAEISAELDIAGKRNIARVADWEASFAETKERIAHETAETETHLQNIEKRVDETMMRIEAAISAAVAESDGRAQDAANDRLAQWKAAFESGDERNARRIAELADLLAKTKCDIAMEQEHAREQNRARATELDAAFAETKTRVEAEIADADARLLSIHDEFDKAMSRVTTAVSAAVAESDGRAQDAANDRLAQWKAAFESGDERNVRRIAELEALAAQTKADISADLDRAGARNKDRMAELDAAFAETKTRVEAEIADADARLLSIHDEFDKAMSRVTTAVSAAVAESDGKAQDAANDRLAQWKAAFESGDERNARRIAELADMLAKTKRDIAMEQEHAYEQNRARATELDAAFAEIKNHMEMEIENAEKQLRYIQQEIDKTSDHIRSAISMSVEDVELRIRTTAEAINTNTNRMSADLEAAINQTKTQFEEEIVQAETWLQSIHDKLAETASTIKSDMKNAIEEAEAQSNEKNAAFKRKFKEMEANADAMIQKLEDQFQKAAEHMEQDVLLETDAKFDEYRAAQMEQFRRFELLAEDTTQLENELRVLLQDAEMRVRTDFSTFEKSSEEERKTVLASFEAASASLKREMANIEQELAVLKERTQENVSEKLKIFEDDFTTNLNKRTEAVDHQLTEWKQFLDNQLAVIAEEAEYNRKGIETVYTEKLETGLNKYNGQLTAQLEKLKEDADSFEEGVRTQMKIADESLSSLKQQFHQDMEDARSSAEAVVRSEIGKHDLAVADTLKQNQRDIEAKLKKMRDDIEGRSAEIAGLFETSKNNLDEWKQSLNIQLRDLETAMEETRKRNRDLATESNERLSNVRASIEDVRMEADAHRAELFSHIDEQARSLDATIKEADRHIKEFASQTSLFERADTLKHELEHHIEDMRDDLDRLDQRRTEATDLENQFVKIKRLEDEVNAKMTRFLSEKHRIEQMETEFSRLLQTSKAVDEKLAQLSASDDTLQAMQVEIRKFNDALESSEERYLRIERKNQTLAVTNEGIDRNFKMLQESEQAAARINAELLEFSSQVTSFRSMLGVLTAESDKAQDVANKIKTLDVTLTTIDERIASAQASREWLARLETRLEELNRQAQEQVKLMGTLMKENSPGSGGASKDKSAPPIGVRENVIKLAHQGWTVDEIARSLKLGRGEVELILELSQKG
jgi:DNA repair exonuclease SbcCD ATPase subunit